MAEKQTINILRRTSKKTKLIKKKISFDNFEIINVKLSNLIIFHMEMPLKEVLLCIYIFHLCTFQQNVVKATRLHTGKRVIVSTL